MEAGASNRLIPTGDIRNGATPRFTRAANEAATGQLPQRGRGQGYVLSQGRGPGHLGSQGSGHVVSQGHDLPLPAHQHTAAEAAPSRQPRSIRDYGCNQGRGLGHLDSQGSRCSSNQGLGSEHCPSQGLGSRHSSSQGVGSGHSSIQGPGSGQASGGGAGHPDVQDRGQRTGGRVVRRGAWYAYDQWTEDINNNYSISIYANLQQLAEEEDQPPQEAASTDRRWSVTTRG